MFLYNGKYRKSLNTYIGLLFSNDRISFYATNSIAGFLVWTKMALYRNILRHIIYSKVKQKERNKKRKIICFLFNITTIFGSHFPDPI